MTLNTGKRYAEIQSGYIFIDDTYLTPMEDDNGKRADKWLKNNICKTKPKNAINDGNGL